ncbi:MAG: hypothetical protein ABL888_14565 [Pirellulaceae bacterium]
MWRIVAGVVAGFVVWIAVWIGAEQILSAIWPDWFGAQQRAFQEAIENGGAFTADSAFLITQVVIGAVVSFLVGLLTASIAGENRRSVVILGFLLLALGILKMSMSWSLVPPWYHATFTLVLFPFAYLGGKLKTPKSENAKV